MILTFSGSTTSSKFFLKDLSVELVTVYAVAIAVNLFLVIFLEHTIDAVPAQANKAEEI